ncbi:hypothetical protein Plhal304r1_c020g0071831 [Plasmopara halstedii]
MGSFHPRWHPICVAFVYLVFLPTWSSCSQFAFNTIKKIIGGLLATYIVCKTASVRDSTRLNQFKHHYDQVCIVFW